MPSLNDLRDVIHEIALNKGWWEQPRTFGEVIALIHSEVSEALEEYRNGKPPAHIYFQGTGETKPGKPEGIPIEFADVIIRILDYCGAADIDIDEAVRSKMAYNKTRAHRHGGKVL